MEFKNKLTHEELKILLYDLECLELKETENNKYHYNLLRGNLLDLGNKAKWES